MIVDNDKGGTAPAFIQCLCTVAGIGKWYKKWYRKKERSAFLLSLRVPKFEHCSIPVAGSTYVAVSLDFIWVCSFSFFMHLVQFGSKVVQFSVPKALRCFDCVRLICKFDAYLLTDAQSICEHIFNIIRFLNGFIDIMLRHGSIGMS